MYETMNNKQNVLEWELKIKVIIFTRKNKSCFIIIVTNLI